MSNDGIYICGSERVNDGADMVGKAVLVGSCRRRKKNEATNVLRVAQPTDYLKGMMNNQDMSECAMNI